MECLKENKRTIFDLFNIYICNDCKTKYVDESIKIGKNSINIYYINECHYRIKDDFFNKKLIKLLIEFSINPDMNIFLWGDDFININKYMDIYEKFLDLDYSLHIIF